MLLCYFVTKLPCHFDPHFCSIAIGTHGRIAFYDAYLDGSKAVKAREQRNSNIPYHSLKQTTRFHHHLSYHLIDLSIVNRVGNIIRESSRCDVAIHHNSYLVVIAHETLLRQHSMKGMEAHSVQSDGRGRDVQEFNAPEARFKGSFSVLLRKRPFGSSAKPFGRSRSKIYSSLPSAVYFFSARSTPTFQVLILSSCRSREATSFTTWSMGMP